MEVLKISVLLTQKQLLKARLSMLYNKPIFKFFTGLGIFLILMSPVSFNLSGKFPFQNILVGTFLAFLFPISNYFYVRKEFKSNARVTEELQYEFYEDKIKITGSSFNTELLWEKIFMVSFRKKWIFLFPSKLIVNIIPRDRISNEEIEKLKTIISKYPSIKSN